MHNNTAREILKWLRKKLLSSDKTKGSDHCSVYDKLLDSSSAPVIGKNLTVGKPILDGYTLCGNSIGRDIR